MAEKLLLAIDAGNTNISFALFEGDTVKASFRLGDAHHKTADDYAVWLLQLLHWNKIVASDIGAAIIASVVPEVDYPLSQLCQRYFGVNPFFTNAQQLALNIALPNVEEIGADRLVNAIAAREYYGCPAIVIDFGTATTFDLIDSQGTYQGGVIAPGLNLSLDALYHAAAKLPRVAIVRPEKVVGTSTVTAMQAGLYWGYVGLIEGLVSRLSAEAFPGQTPKIITTGGLGSLFTDAVRGITAHDADLTLKGLYHIHTTRMKTQKS